LYQYLGLPPGTPPEMVRELMLELVRQGGNPDVSNVEVIEASRLWAFVENAANSATIMESLLNIAEKGAEFISQLPL
ncbi:hypothetical protein, partial [Leifsonia sp. SIMBA_070]|uniref:hypothetical protein n=1 Tax=Leifsonia sp. SIMBA_070 TaxID=3085810 RepID=UPI00397B71FD